MLKINLLKFAGIWKDRDITQESIRRKAWRGNKDLLDIEPISKDDKDYEYIVKGRAERISNPENYGTLDNINEKDFKTNYSY